MSAFLKKLFKSKRPNPADVQKPIEIEKLDPRRASDREALFQLVAGPQSSERQINAALTKTGDLDIIVRWYVDAPSRVQVLIADWIARQTTNTRRLAQARSRLNDPQLQQVFDQLSSGATKLPGTAHAIPGRPDQLEKMAIEARISQERQQAAEQINDEITLQRIARAAKGRDKGVYQIARQKLQVLRNEAAKVAANHAEVERLIEQCETHAQTESTQLYVPRFESLRNTWAGLEEAASEEQKQRFHAAHAVCQVRCNELAAQAQSAARADARAQERLATLALLQQTLEQLRRASPEQIPSVSSLDAMQKTQENRWLEASRDSQIERQQQRDYEQLMQGLRQYLQAIQVFETHRAALENAAGQTTTEQNMPEDRPVQEDQADALKAILTAIAWPDGYTPPVELSRARAQVKSSPAKTANSTPVQAVDHGQLQDLLDKLEQVLEKKDLKPSRKILKEAQHLAANLPEKARRPFQGRLTLMAHQVQDLQDWQGFATRPKQEALCEQMEHLAKQPMDPDLKAAKIHALQQQWRELGGSSDQVLWQGFKEAADLAFAPCQDYFAARNELKSANLHKREQICDELGMFIGQADWTACDWRGIEKIHRKAREEWRDTKPIDFRRNRDVQRRFDELLKELDAQLNGERERNEAAKAAIVAKARELGSHEPLGEAINQAKNLQKQWEGVGITRQRQDRALWQSFRAACDVIFSRRDSQRADQQNQDAEQQAAAEALLMDIDQQLQASQIPQDQQAIAERLRAFSQLSLPAGQRDRLEKRFQALRRQFEESARHATRQQQKEQWLERLRHDNAGMSDSAEAGDTHALKELCIRAEILTGIESPPEDQAQRMTLQVERLAAGMGQGQNFPDTRAEIDHLISLWQRHAPATPEPALMARMEKAIDAL